MKKIDVKLDMKVQWQCNLGMTLTGKVSGFLDDNIVIVITDEGLRRFVRIPDLIPIVGIKQFTLKTRV